MLGKQRKHGEANELGRVKDRLSMAAYTNTLYHTHTHTHTHMNISLRARPRQEPTGNGDGDGGRLRGSDRANARGEGPDQPTHACGRRAVLPNPGKRSDCVQTARALFIGTAGVRLLLRALWATQQYSGMRGRSVW